MFAHKDKLLAEATAGGGAATTDEAVDENDPAALKSLLQAERNKHQKTMKEHKKILQIHQQVKQLLNTGIVSGSAMKKAAGAGTATSLLSSPSKSTTVDTSFFSIATD